MSAENPDLRFRAACYGRDDKKGRKEIVKQINNGSSFNVLMINEQLQRVRELAQSAKSSLPQDRILELSHA